MGGNVIYIFRACDLVLFISEFWRFEEYLRSVRLATPAKVVMGTLGISRSITKVVYPQPKTIVFDFFDSVMGFDYNISVQWQSLERLNLT